MVRCGGHRQSVLKTASSIKLTRRRHRSSRLRVFSFLDGQGSNGAGMDAGRQEPGLQPSPAAVTFYRMPAFGIHRDHRQGAGRSTGPAASAFILREHHKSGFVPGDGPGGTYLHASPTVDTAHGVAEDPAVLFPPLHVPQRLLPKGTFDIPLIVAGQLAGTAAGALLRIKDNAFHGFSSFLILHRMQR